MEQTLSNEQTALEPCCAQACLLKHSCGSIEGAVETVQQLRHPLANMLKCERKDFIAIILQRSLFQDSPTSNRMSWQRIIIGVTPEDRFPVCKKCFSSIYGISLRSMDKIVHDCKRLNFQPHYNAHHDQAALSAYTPHARQCLMELARKFEVDLTEEQIIHTLLPETMQSISTFVWMQHYFVDFGMPHDDGRVMLTSDTKKHVWEVYKKECDASHSTSPSYSNFVKLWRVLFPKVHVRAYVQEVGSCPTCALLVSALEVATCSNDRAWVRFLREIHRAAYMSQKTPYYEERKKSQEDPKSLLLLAWDGMDKQKTKFPSKARLARLNKPVAHHVQGLVNHGFNRKHFLQTFNNVAMGCNVAIHHFLLEVLWCLEATDSENWSRHLSCRYDGGSENISRAFMVICEKLVSERIFLSIRITRGKVGHNSDDCDAMFAKVRNTTALKSIATQAAFAAAIEGSFSDDRTVVNQAYIVPDYYAWATSCIDPRFSHYCKGDEAIHVFLMEAVQVCSHFGKGVLTSWRHYDAESYDFIINDETKPLNLGFISRSCKWFPEATADKPFGVQLTHKDLDLVKLMPAPFVPDSASALVESHEAVKDQFTDTAVLSEWERWVSEDLPANDSAQEYKNLHPDQWKNPLAQILSPKFSLHRHQLDDVIPVGPSDAIPFTNTVNSSHSKRKPGVCDKKRLKKSKSNVAEAPHDTVVPLMWHEVVDQSTNAYKAAALYVGREFIDEKDYHPHDNPFTHGKVVAVVECDAIEGLHFKFYNPTKHPDAPPAIDADEDWGYTVCKPMIRKNAANYKWIHISLI
jgi:hypothetical protein